MIWGQIHILTWIVLFLITILYEILYVKYILAISKLRPFLTANISLMLGAVGMACVIIYTEEINNCVPILGATWLSSYFIIGLEKKKRAKEEQKNDVKNNN
jgi:ribose/xylose/arabinose/galactoside ABC-type transport system permease subunit